MSIFTTAATRVIACLLTSLVVSSPSPTLSPSHSPSITTTSAPSESPVTPKPTISPSPRPTDSPSASPTKLTISPTQSPTNPFHCTSGSLAGPLCIVSGLNIHHTGDLTIQALGDLVLENTVFGNRALNVEQYSDLNFSVSGWLNISGSSISGSRVWVDSVMGLHVDSNSSISATGPYIIDSEDVQGVDISQRGGGGGRSGSGSPSCQDISGGPAYGNPLRGELGFGGSGAPDKKLEHPGMGGRGGGIISIETDIAKIDGRISADGNTPSSPSAGGGAGGTVSFSIMTILDGTGIVSANGAAGYAGGGAGGGGLIVLDVHQEIANAIEDNSNSAPSFSVHGGTVSSTSPSCKSGGAGLIYFKQQNSLICSGRNDYSSASVSTLWLWLSDATQNGAYPLKLKRLTFEQNCKVTWKFNGNLTLNITSDITLKSSASLSAENPVVIHTGSALISSFASLYGLSDIYFFTESFQITGGQIQNQGRWTKIYATNLISLDLSAQMRLQHAYIQAPRFESSAKYISCGNGNADFIANVQNFQIQENGAGLVASRIEIYAITISILGNLQAAFRYSGNNCTGKITNGRLAKQSIYVKASVMTVDVSGTLQGGWIKIDVERLFVDGLITASHLGCLPGKGKGAGAYKPIDASEGQSYPGGGGGHAGKGGSGDYTPEVPGGISYGISYLQPSAGSGGGQAPAYTPTTTDLGSGGGVVYIKASVAITVSGTVSASGKEGKDIIQGECTGGGAGGTILLQSPHLTGTGFLVSNGGNGGHGGGGGGGGGYIVYWKMVTTTTTRKKNNEEEGAHAGNLQQQQQQDSAFFLLAKEASSSSSIHHHSTRMITSRFALLDMLVGSNTTIPTASAKGGESSPDHKGGNGLVTRKPECNPGHFDLNCAACPTGAFKPFFNGSCEQCLPGTYMNVTGAASCRSCSRGKYSAGHGSVECERCPAGTFVDKVGASHCQNCPEGTFSKTGSSSCVQCPPNTFRNKDNAGDVCLACPTGRYSASNSSKCYNCTNPKPKSYWKPFSGCEYECKKGYVYPDCILPISAFIKDCGGPVIFSVIIICMLLAVIFPFIICFLKRRWKKQHAMSIATEGMERSRGGKRKEPFASPVDEYQRLEYIDDNNNNSKSTKLRIQNQWLDPSKLHLLMHRIYLHGGNTPDDPLYLLIDDAPYNLGVHKGLWIGFQSQLNDCFRWDNKEQWIYAFLCIIFVPLGYFYLRRKQQEKLELAITYVAEYNHEFFKNQHIKALSSSLRLSASKVGTYAWIDIVAPNENTKNEIIRGGPDGNPGLVLMCCGSGTFTDPFYLDAQDVLVQSLSKFYGRSWCSCLAHLNTHLRRIKYKEAGSLQSALNYVEMVQKGCGIGLGALMPLEGLSISLGVRSMDMYLASKQQHQQHDSMPNANNLKQAETTTLFRNGMDFKDMVMRRREWRPVVIIEQGKAGTPDNEIIPSQEFTSENSRYESMSISLNDGRGGRAGGHGVGGRASSDYFGSSYYYEGDSGGGGGDAKANHSIATRRKEPQQQQQQQQHYKRNERGSRIRASSSRTVSFIQAPMYGTRPKFSSIAGNDEKRDIVLSPSESDVEENVLENRENFTSEEEGSSSLMRRALGSWKSQSGAALERVSSGRYARSIDSSRKESKSSSIFYNEDSKKGGGQDRRKNQGGGGGGGGDVNPNSDEIRHQDQREEEEEEEAFEVVSSRFIYRVKTDATAADLSIPSKNQTGGVWWRALKKMEIGNAGLKGKSWVVGTIVLLIVSLHMISVFYVEIALFFKDAPYAVIPLIILPGMPQAAFGSSMLGIALSSPLLVRSSAVFWSLSLINALCALIVDSASSNVVFETLATVGQLLLALLAALAAREYAAHVDFHRDIRYMQLAINSQGITASSLHGGNDNIGANNQRLEGTENEGKDKSLSTAITQPQLSSFENLTRN